MLMLSVVPKEEEGQSQILDPSGRNGNTSRGTKHSRCAADGDDIELLDVAADTGVAADSADGMHRVKWRFCPAYTAGVRTAMWLALKSQFIHTSSPLS
jgi:hypothetical protein